MSSIFASCGDGGASGQVHKCAGAGQWFSGSERTLRPMIEGYLDGAKFEMPEGRVVALVGPHAGYKYSGPVAGYSYATVRGKSFKRVLVLAFSHRYPVRGLSVGDFDSYETPLGSIPVDRECVKALLKHNFVNSVPAAHAAEWSDENQLPFLQVALKPGWKMASVFVGQFGDADFDTAAEALRPFITADTLVVVSSDFTHIENAVSAKQKKMDLGAAQRLVAKDFRGFLDYMRADPHGQGSVCGHRPLALMLRLLDDDAKGHLLHHNTSGDMLGNYGYSVGYCAIVYTAPAPKSPSGKKATEATVKKATEAVAGAFQNKPVPAKLECDDVLTPKEEEELLRLARTTLTTWVEGRSKKIDLSKFSLTDRLRRKRGAFVTLNRDGHLRGCIGYITPVKPLHETVMENARNAATNDRRFRPVTAAELAKIDLEISVMSPLRKVASVNEIVPGKHGLVIKKGRNQGVFLPQVPVEQKWDLRQYLDNICRKASLPTTAWKNGAEFYVFTAEVFGEKNGHGNGKAK